VGEGGNNKNKSAEDVL